MALSKAVPELFLIEQMQLAPVSVQAEAQARITANLAQVSAHMVQVSAYKAAHRRRR